MITKEWLEQRYIKDLVSIWDIATEAGCSAANIRRYLKKWKILRGKKAIVGKPAWNSGLTKDEDERLAKLAKDRTGEGNPMYGSATWNAGLSKETDHRVAKVATALTGRSHSTEVKKRMSAAKLGKCGEKANAWKGGTQYSNGYGVNRISVSGKRIYAHRHVAQQVLGRQLLEDEHVHHVDRNRQNNSKENLIVIADVNHNRLHRAIEAGHESRAQQIAWLKANDINFEELIYENFERESA